MLQLFGRVARSIYEILIHDPRLDIHGLPKLGNSNSRGIIISSSIHNRELLDHKVAVLPILLTRITQRKMRVFQFKMVSIRHIEVKDQDFLSIYNVSNYIWCCGIYC
ncbi:hypothetical protein P3S67_015731 [Capsicum chacoense]